MLILWDWILGSLVAPSHPSEVVSGQTQSSSLEHIAWWGCDLFHKSLDMYFLTLWPNSQASRGLGCSYLDLWVLFSQGHFFYVPCLVPNRGLIPFRVYIKCWVLCSWFLVWWSFPFDKMLSDWWTFFPWRLGIRITEIQLFLPLVMLAGCPMRQCFVSLIVRLGYCSFRWLFGCRESQFLFFCWAC